MFDGHPVIDADSHKCENPVLFLDYIDAPYRSRLSFVRDRYGEQRIRILDRGSRSGSPDLVRLFLQPEGWGKGTYRPYHAETTLGGLFNRLRLAHMDREGIDHQVVYGSVALAFNSLLDVDLAVALCRAYNDYIFHDCEPHRRRLHPAAVLPLQDPVAAVAELRRCVLERGMLAVTIAPNLPQPHPSAPDHFPEVRIPKHLSHPDFFPIYQEAERLDVAIGIHGAPGFQLAGGASDQLDTFTLVHVFANRDMQQMALAKLVFDGVMERFPRLRFGFLEAGCGWLPDFLHNLREHWEKRIVQFDPDVEPRLTEILHELARERGADLGRDLLRKAKGLLGLLFSPSEEAAPRAELERFWYEHPDLPRDPREYVERGQIFLTVEPGDQAPTYLPLALGEMGERVCGMATDYGHWDATLKNCVGLTADHPGISRAHAIALLSSNSLRFYGDRLRERITC